MSSGQLNQQQRPLDTSNFPPDPDFPPIVPPYTSTISFSVPVSSDLIFLLARGSLDYSSSVNFELSENAGDDVEIDVTMSYYSNEARKRAQICLLERDEGEKGVGIFVSRVPGAQCRFLTWPSFLDTSLALSPFPKTARPDQVSYYYSFSQNRFWETSGNKCLGNKHGHLEPSNYLSCEPG